ncbi:MAG: type IV secretory system conjugative DNA transfer family protein [Erysipelotrichaceae bacterium]
MFRKIILYALLFTATYYILEFAILQMIYLSALDNFAKVSYTLDYSYFNLNETTKMIQQYLYYGCVIFFVLLLINEIAFKKFLSRYQKKNYSKLLTEWQRKRGTVRLQFDKQGKITRNTLEIFVETKLLPITKAQNKLADHFHLPETQKWNTIKEFEVDGHKQFITGGVPVIAYRRYFLFGKYNRVYLLPGNVHNLFFGSTGRGKSFTFVLAMIFFRIYAGENMVIHDIKGELLAYTRKAAEDAGYHVIVIDWTDPSCGEGWNPLAYPYEKWKEAVNKTETKDYHDADVSEAVELVLDMAKTISYQEDAKDPFWHEGAGDMIAGAALLLFESGIDEYVNFTSVRYIYQLGMQKRGSSTYLQDYLNKYRSVEDESVLKMDTFLSAEGLTRSSLKSVFQNKISLLTATDAIKQMTAKSTFTFDQVFKNKTAVYIVSHDEKTTYYPLVAMFFKQLYEAGIKITRDNPKDNKLSIPMTWIIDEFARLPEIKDIEAMYTAARSRGLSINAFVQSPEQLMDRYEKNGAAIIEDNSTHVLYLNSKHDGAAEKFEQMAGSELVYDAKEKDYKERPVITKERLKQFEKGRSLLTSTEWNPYIVKLPPFNEYVFATQPDWSKHKIEKDKLQYFNIKETVDQSMKNKVSNKGTGTVNFKQLMKKEEEWMDDLVSSEQEK